MPLPPEQYLGIVEHSDGTHRIVPLRTRYEEEMITDPATGLSTPVGRPVYEPAVPIPVGAVLLEILLPDERNYL